MSDENRTHKTNETRNRQCVSVVIVAADIYWACSRVAGGPELSIRGLVGAGTRMGAGDGLGRETQ